MFQRLQFVVATLLVFLLAIACYRRPLPDDFDRYVYEAIVRGKTQPMEQVYAVVKHETPRAEGSSVLDSPQHLRELEPLYAIRPLYVAAISWASHVLPIQKAINLISAASLLGIGFVLMLWTKRPLLSVLLLAYYPVLSLGRGGSPDALAALLALSALFLIHRQRWYIPALCILFVSLGVRTDNLLLLLCVLIWLTWEEKIGIYMAASLGAVAIATVLAINHWEGNYGWVVLFRYSFIGGRYPALEPHTLSVREYFSAFFTGASVMLTRAALWICIGIVTFLNDRDRLLLLAGCAAAMHFLLFPSGEDRYIVWAYIVTAVVFIDSFAGSGSSQNQARRSALNVESENTPGVRV